MNCRRIVSVELIVNAVMNCSYIQNSEYSGGNFMMISLEITSPGGLHSWRND